MRLIAAVLLLALCATAPRVNAQTIEASPSSCVTGQTCRPRLTWSGFPCAAPTASAVQPTGSWSGPQTPSGSKLLSNTSATRTYTLTCPAVVVGMGSALLQWTPPTHNDDGTPLDDLAGYRAYWGATPGTYSYQATISTPTAPSYNVTGLTNAAPWYFVVTAFNEEGGESSYSNVATKVISGSNDTLPAVERSVTVTVGPATPAPPAAATDIVTGGTFTTLATLRRYFVGDAVPISTPAVSGATRYEWEIEHAEIRTVDARSSTSPSTTWTPQRAGPYVARVRPCNAAGCAAWLSTVDRGYVVHAWLRAPGF